MLARCTRLHPPYHYKKKTKQQQNNNNNNNNKQTKNKKQITERPEESGDETSLLSLIYTPKLHYLVSIILLLTFQKDEW